MGESAADLRSCYAVNESTERARESERERGRGREREREGEREGEKFNYVSSIET